MDSEGIKKLAKLAKISISPEEEKKYVNEFNQIFDFFEILNKIPTDDVRPLTHVTATENGADGDTCEDKSPIASNAENMQAENMRADQVQKSTVDRETALDAAERFGSFFKVPLVIGGDSA